MRDGSISIHLLWNLTSFVILIRLRSPSIPREPVQWRGAQVKEHDTVKEEKKTERIKNRGETDTLY